MTPPPLLPASHLPNQYSTERAKLKHLSITSLQHTRVLFLFPQVLNLHPRGAHARGVRVDWSNWGGGGHLVGVTESSDDLAAAAAAVWPDKRSNACLH